jgi:hypothetical protein
MVVAALDGGGDGKQQGCVEAAGAKRGGHRQQTQQSLGQRGRQRRQLATVGVYVQLLRYMMAAVDDSKAVASKGGKDDCGY